MTRTDTVLQMLRNTGQGNLLLSAGDHSDFALSCAATNAQYVRDAWCSCATPGQVAYYRREDGIHGWACDRCCGITQTG